MNPVDLADVRSRARAAFLGLALGDALGATVEFLTPAEIRAAHGVHREIIGGGWLHLRPGRVTDDTEMALCIARAIDAAGGWDLRGVAERFVSWMRAGPSDIGSTCRKGIRRFMLEGSLEGPPHEGDGGNGAAMRVLPVALFTAADGPLQARLAVEQARITHHHPLSDAGTVHVGELVHLALLGRGKPRLRRASDALVGRHPRFAFDPYPGRASGFVVDTLQTVLHVFFGTRGLEECVVEAVNRGEDADTTGAIAGAIAGAYYGEEQLPRRWLRRLDPAVREELEALADRLVLLSPLARGEPPVEGVEP
ncbi:MAG TPA: ADP-ribosyl-[dinitrogen reductase] hydrolase [Anaeromyxobacter sp.]